jgi:hypothetical protein
MKNFSKIKIFAIAVLTSFILFLLAYFYYKSESEQIINEKHQFLDAVTSIKLDQIIEWRKERISEAKFFPTIGKVIKYTVALNENKYNEEAQQYFFNALMQFKANDYYENIFIADINSKVLFSLDSGFTSIDPLRAEEIKFAIESDSVIIGDFYLCRTHNLIHFNVISTIKDNSGIPIGAFVQHVDPSKSFYPLIQKWPTLSKTGETLLFKKENNHIVYLNELRHKKNTAVPLKIQMSETEMVAVKAVLGARGIVEGKDYRNVDVLADVKTVPGTNWFMVSKVDKDEIYTEVFFRAKSISLLAFFAILLVGVLAMYFYKLKQSYVYKNLFLKEKELHETQEEYRTTLYSIGDAVITTDTLGNIKQMNSVAESLTEWNENEAKGKSLSSVFKVINEDTNQPVENPVTRVLKDGLVVGLANHTLLISKSGQKIPIADSGSPIKNADGKITGVVLVFRDQSEERENEKILIESEEKFRKAFTTSPDSININRLSDGIYITINDGFTKMTGYAEDEVIGKSSLDINIWADVKDRNKLVAGLKEKGIVDNLEARFRLKNGEVKSGLMSASIIQLAGEPHILSITRDITERKRFEAALKYERDRVRAILNLVGDPIFVKDEQHRFTLGNKAFIEMVGLDENKVIGKTLAEDIPEDEMEHFLKIDRLVLDTGIPDTREEELTINNQTKTIITSKTRFTDDSGNRFLIGSMHDITDRKNAEKEKAHFNDLMKYIISNTKSSVSVFDTEMNYIYVSDRYFDDLHLADKNLIGRNHYDVFPDLPQFLRDIHKRSLRGETISGENDPLMHADGSVDRANWTSMPWYNTDGIIGGIIVYIEIITERKQAEKALKESEEKFRRMTLNSPMGMHFYELKANNDLILVDSNPAADKLLGINHTLLIGKTIEQAFPPLAKTEVPQRYREAASDGLFWATEQVSYKDDKVEGAFEVNAYQTKPNNMVAVFADITQRKRSESDLQKSEELKNSIVNSLLANVAVIDSEGMIISVNEPWRQFAQKNGISCLSGIAEKVNYLDVIRDSISKGAENLNEILRGIEEVLNGVRNKFETEYSCDSPDEKRWFSMHVTPLYFGGGAVISHENITDRILAETKVRKLSRAVEQSPAIIMITNVNGDIEYINPKFTEVTDYSLDEVIGKNPRILKSGHTPLEEYEDLWKNISAGREWRGEFFNKKKNGELYWESAVISPLFDEQGKLTNYIAVKEDITERKLLISDLVEAKAKAEEMNRVKAYFFANMSHELRTPFVGIMGYSEMLAESLNSPAEKEMAEQILKSSKRLTDTLNKILNVTRLEFDKVDVKLSDVDIVEMIKQLRALFSKSGTIKNTVIGSTFTPDIIRVRTDAKLLEEILTNLLNNAIKYTHDGAIEILVRSLSNEHGDYLIIKVADTGVGIPKEKQEIIWQEFRQASEGMNRSFEGTGLGLTIIKKYVNTLGGQISVESEVGKGSTFTIELPVINLGEKEIEVQQIKESKIAVISDVPRSRKPKVLYVEDDVIALSYVDKVLRSLYEIDTAFNASIALDLANKNKYEVIMLDINLGKGIDGIELMQMMRKIDGYSHIPMVAVTAYAAESDRLDFLAKGFTHYLSKPFTSVELRAILSRMFNKINE